MNQPLLELVQEISQLTGTAVPAMAHADAPVLSAGELRPEADYYLVGMIGGKDVGKSALINAIAEHPITLSTSWGEGTQDVVAYVHKSRRDAVARRLNEVAPGRHKIVEHNIPTLQKQVLVDLPDIDSHYQQHVQLTRRMLRHMLFPIWVQSVEKYADRQMQDLLRQVAQGNDPANFVFCLNKVDQLPGMIRTAGAARKSRAIGDASAMAGLAGFSEMSKGSTPAAGSQSGTASGPTEAAMAELEELRSDYARRIAAVLGLEDAPPVYAVSAMTADGFDLPAMRGHIGKERNAADVSSARSGAARRQSDVVLKWVGDQNLPAQLERTIRLSTQARQMMQSRLLPVVMDRVVVPQTESVSSRLEMIDQCMGQRVRHWPIVQGVHAMLWPVLALIRRNVEPAGMDANGRPSVQSVAEISAALQGTFATLQQSQPVVAGLYSQRKLWEPQTAEQAVSQLFVQVDQASQTQQRAVIEKLGKPTPWLWPMRWLLTIGAILWFPIVQPILAAWLGMMDMGWPSMMDVLRVVVTHLGVNFLLENLAFLVGWHLLLWMMLRWDVQRKVDRHRRRIAHGAMDREAADPQAAAMAWMDDLLEPLESRGDKLKQVLDRVQAVREESAA